jgi:hypothetical protein
MVRNQPPRTSSSRLTDFLPGHDGQITSPLQLWRVQPLSQKYFCFSEIKIRLYDLPSHPEIGALRNVINAGRVAVDVDGAFDESA